MWYWVFRGISLVILKVFFRLKVEGLENIPKKSNFIIVANHSSYLDPFVVGAAIPQKVYWIAWKHFYKRLITKWFMQKTDTLPAAGNSSEKAVFLLMENKNVGLFPEGRRSFDGKVGEFRRGAALLALKTGRPIVPCSILGAYEALPRGAKFPRLRQIKIKIGRPKYLFKEFEDIVDDLYLEDGIFQIRNTIREMIYAG
ncbi:MAG: lysophospholipid acyltransferase family protein [Candidatus Omnitrophica bacterium]|nr:lysophospholipid acyltransferase family protein [Candidatus Omnitrophota bacterium]